MKGILLELIMSKYLVSIYYYKDYYHTYYYYVVAWSAKQAEFFIKKYFGYNRIAIRELRKVREETDKSLLGEIKEAFI